MAEESSTQSTTEQQGSMQQTGDLDATLAGDGEAMDVTFDPLFDDESVSDEDLGATDEGSTQQKTSETDDSQGDKSASSQSKDDQKGETQDSSGTDDKGSDSGDSDLSDQDVSGDQDKGAQTSDKPQKGYVPIQALHEERGKRQSLSQEVQTLRQELEAVKNGKQDADQDGDKAGGEDFKILSEQEFNDLLEDDPVEAIKYDRKLRAYQDQQRQQQEAQQTEQQVVDKSVQRMSEAIPGLYDEDNDVNQQLTDFAVEKGFTDLDGLSMITDPATKVVPSNGGAPQPLGETAAHLVVMLNNLYQGVAQAASQDDKGVDKEALTKEIEAKVTKELLGKIKQPGGAEHRSIADAPGDSGEDIATKTVMTEAEFANQPEDVQRRLLGG